MSRKAPTFRELLTYLSKPAEKGPLILHNLLGNPESSTSLEHELRENARHLRRRRNGNVLYHEIISFSSEDREHITPEIAEAVTRFYLEHRAPYALAFAQAHFNTDCPHIHLVISANNLGSTKRIRLTKPRFEAIKKEVTRFVHSRYPELTHSLDLPPKDQQRPKERRSESERHRRGEKHPSRKQIVRDQVTTALLTAISGEDLFRLLAEHGLRPYQRGSSIGIEDITAPSPRRYRMKTLGIEGQFTKTLQHWRSQEPVFHQRPGHERDLSR